MSKSADPPADPGTSRAAVLLDSQAGQAVHKIGKLYRQTGIDLAINGKIRVDDLEV